MMKYPLVKTCLLTAFLPLLLTTHVVGAMITWQTPVSVNVNDPTQVLNNGTYFTSQSATGNTPTINGVTFETGWPHVTTIGYTNGGSNGGSVTTSYSSLLTASLYMLDSQAAGGGAAAAMVYNGLTPGQTYEFQVWSGFGSGNTVYYSAIAPSLSLGSYHAVGESGGVIANSTGGQFVVGTFVADTSSQSLYYYGNLGSDPNQQGQFSAYQIRAVPEPTTVALLALGGLVLVMRRKLRRLA